MIAAAPTREDFELPRTRRDCLPGGCNAERPCPVVSCKHHLYLDVDPDTGHIKFNHPDIEPWELTETCSLDVAGPGLEREAELIGTNRWARGDEHTLVEVGERLNITRERVRQIETRALLKLKLASPSSDRLGARAVRKATVTRAVIAEYDRRSRAATGCGT